MLLDFPGSSAGKEIACNAGNPSSTSGLGRPPGELIGYPLHYSWASLVAQMIKNLPAMRDTWVPTFPSTSAGDLRELLRVPLRGEGCCVVGRATREIGRAHV